MSYTRNEHKHNRRIETSREVRLWLERIIFFVVFLIVVVVICFDFIVKIKNTFARGGTGR